MLLLVLIFSLTEEAAPVTQVSVVQPTTSNQRSPEASGGCLIETETSACASEWPEKFAVPWKKMPQGIKEAVKKQKRPNPSDRRKMVRILVDSMQEQTINPARAQCAIIAKRIVQQHPQCFADRADDDEILGCGYFSLLTQIKSRVEHVNRNNTLARLRAPKSATRGLTVAPQHPVGVDSYGCINWQPQETPDGETEESLESSRALLCNLYSEKGPLATDDEETRKLMHKTYFLQRQNINGPPVLAVKEIQQMWPYLFQPRHMFEHFASLTGIEILPRFRQAMERKGERIYRFFLGKKERLQQDLQLILSTMDNTSVTGVIILVMRHFKESENSLLLLSDVSF